MPATALGGGCGLKTGGLGVGGGGPEPARREAARWLAAKAKTKQF
ncbi:MAG: hypothetical protein ACYCPM_10930 [Acidobacteriaceae bacterium]